MKVLICDLVGLKFNDRGEPDCSEVRSHIESRGEAFHHGTPQKSQADNDGKIHFFYQPALSRQSEILALTKQGHFDGVIAAATVIPKDSVFLTGGVRIGAGTGNMQSASWGGPSGQGGSAPLMNTPGFNARATAQMVLKALLRVSPDLNFGDLHARVMAGTFDTGRDLKNHPTEKLEGKRLCVLGFGNIGREVCRLGKALGMMVTVFARPVHQPRIEREGYRFASNPHAAAEQADVLSVHIGLGDPANIGFVGRSVFERLNHNAILINFDRGEVVDGAALDQALACHQIAHAAIDADVFKDETTGSLSGPLVPYIALANKYPGRLTLLPHVAADTDHPSRVAGAKQAVDQIIAAIREKTVINVKGDVPDGYSDGGKFLPPGIGN